jgi:hypothetical protein
MKAYMQENILPVLKEQRAKLDEQLSSQEQDALTSIREEMKALREQGKALRPAKKELKKSGEMPSQEQRDAMRKHAKAHRLLMNRAWAIADEHERTIYGLLDEISGKQGQWHSDIKAIMEKHKGNMSSQPEEGGENIGDDAPRPGKGKQKRHGGMHGKLGKLKQLNQPVAFLLWDGEQFPGQGMGTGENGERKRGNRAKVVPNPATDQHEVNFTLKTAGQVTFTLLDYAGKPLKQVYSGEAGVGKNTVSLSVKGLDSGLYFYQIESPDGEKAVRFYVN